MAEHKRSPFPKARRRGVAPEPPAKAGRGTPRAWSFSGEQSLDDLLADPMMRMVAASDGLDIDGLRQLVVRHLGGRED